MISIRIIIERLQKRRLLSLKLVADQTVLHLPVFDQFLRLSAVSIQHVGKLATLVRSGLLLIVNHSEMFLKSHRFKLF